MILSRFNFTLFRFFKYSYNLSIRSCLMMFFSTSLRIPIETQNSDTLPSYIIKSQIRATVLMGKRRWGSNSTNGDEIFERA